MDQQLPDVSQSSIEKYTMMEALCRTDVGISFLQYLCRISGHNNPIMTLEDASRRDIWLTVRRYIPVEKLSLIEHEQLHAEQQRTLELIRNLALRQGENTDE